ncbi:MAG: aminotransferase class III-fold pyridoxal phosphate-dependent enzyme [Flavobacteriales bacterium]
MRRRASRRAKVIVCAGTSTGGRSPSSAPAPTRTATPTWSVHTRLRGRSLQRHTRVGEGAEDLNVCAFLVEPASSRGKPVSSCRRMIFIAKAIRACKAMNVLFMADEVQTGIARTGRMLCTEHSGERPGCGHPRQGCVSGGMYPVSLVLADNAMDVFTPGSHGSTFGGNPMAARIAMEALTSKEERLTENAERLGQLFCSEMQKLVDEFAYVKLVRGKGLLNAAIIEPRTAADGTPKTAWELCLLLRDNGLLAKPTHGDIIRFCTAPGDHGGTVDGVLPSSR